MMKLRTWAGLTLTMTLIASCGAPETEGSTSADQAYKARKAARIAVVGAGPSGLTAAYTLQQLGYTNVTVFEKSPQVGGKVLSYNNGAGITELGAVFASPDYVLVNSLAKKFNIPTVPSTLPQYVIDASGNKVTFPEFLQAKYTTAQILAATVAYAAVQTLFVKLQENGFGGLPPDLYLPFGQFATKYGFAPIADLAKCLMIGFGYGYYENTPALYYMKLLGWLVKIGGTTGLEAATYYTFPTGFQSLWVAVAASLPNVKLNSTVTAVTRNPFSANPVTVTINGTTTQSFDAIIISAPLDKVGSFVTLTGQEKQLFSQVGGERYVVNLFAAAGLPTNESDFIYDNTAANTLNHASVWANSNPAQPVYIDYQIVDPAASEATITATLASDVATYGHGTFEGLLLRQEWPDYFPHVSTESLRSGFYDRVELMQGANNTYYVGGTLSFETVEHSARYAQALVLKNFPPALF
jgi:oxygen-dependent protoporphyrinogen oxidase